jgi:uncharacterized protein YegP (UPF0339 family)
MKTPILRVYEDSASQWRWKLQATNGRTIADSSEGYTRMADAVRAAEQLYTALPAARLVVPNTKAVHLQGTPTT